MHLYVKRAKSLRAAVRLERARTAPHIADLLGV